MKKLFLSVLSAALLSAVCASSVLASDSPSPAVPPRFMFPASPPPSIKVFQAYDAPGKVEKDFNDWIAEKAKAGVRVNIIHILQSQSGSANNNTLTLTLIYGETKT